MARTNKKTVRRKTAKNARLAGGYGPYAARQSKADLLRRAVYANLLWEMNFYESGEKIADRIKKLVPKVDPETVAEIAISARHDQKLRHVPLFLAREMARHPDHRKLLGKLLPRIIMRADELAEFMALYWDKKKKQPIAKQVKKGLARAFLRFDEYQLAKYNRDYDVTLRDVMFLVHPKPQTEEQERLFRALANDSLRPPDTWEVNLSAGKSKRKTWERLIRERKMGALAFVRNLRNMENVGVDRSIIKLGFETINPRWLVPTNYLAAAKYAPRWEREIEELMFRGLSQAPKLAGLSIFVVDVSGSMGNHISRKSEYSRLDVACAMAILAAEMCETISIYATGGSDYARKHKTKLLRPRRGFALTDEIKKDNLGGGGIFTRQCLEYIKEDCRCVPERIMVFSDSQDCDHPHKRIPAPFGKRNYIIDVSAHTRGIAYPSIWTAEISGWSEHFLKYVALTENTLQ